ncbi:MAG: hypothetical protein ABI165_02455 [Bryobacteraceae bacterium]
MKRQTPMETIAVESIPIVVVGEEDGRWWADIESMPHVMAYGVTRELAISAVLALALRVAADCIDRGGRSRLCSQRLFPWHEQVEIGRGEATLGRRLKWPALYTSSC